MNQISASSLSHFDVCKRKRAFIYGAPHLRSYRGDLNLIVGSLAHRFLAEYYAGPLPDLDKTIEEIMESFEKETEENLVEYHGDSLDKARATLERIMRSYPGLAFYEDRDIQLEVQALEAPFSIQLTKGTKIVGVLDALIATNRGPMVMDHKTAASIGAKYFYGVADDLQAIIYPWAARELGLEVKFFALNVIAKTVNPYISRHFVPLNWDLIDRKMEWLRKDIEELVDPLPETIPEILQLPPSVVSCRRCQFRDFCFTEPWKAEQIIKSHFTSERKFK